MTDVLIVAGTRPEMIKLAPVVQALMRAGLDVCYLHTRQHEDIAGEEAWGAVPGWPKPKPAHRRLLTDLDTNPMTCAVVWARAMAPTLEPPRCVIVQGDTASSYAGASLVDSWTHVGTQLVHVEAGLRCWDERSPEEAIRRAIDRRADLLLAPSALAMAFAARDMRAGARLHLTGQTGLDALRQVQATARREGDAPRAWVESIAPGHPYVLLTLHRAEWGDRDTVIAFAAAIGKAAAAYDWPVVWPIHPRWGISQVHGVQVVPPIPYRTMAMLLDQDRPMLIVTDSGGLVEEAYAHGVPTVILRDSTERWEAVAEDAAILCPPRHGVEHAASVVDIAMRFANEAVRERGHAYDSPDPRYTASELVRDHIAALVDR